MTPTPPPFRPLHLGVHLGALMLSVAAHFFLLSSIGFRSGAAIHASMDASARNVTVSLLEPARTGQPRTKRAARAEAKKPEPAQAMPALPAAAPAPADSAPLIEIATPGKPHYFPANQLAEKPAVLFDATPELALELSGEASRSAVLRLLINEQGDIDEVIVERSGFSESALRSVRETFGKMKFQPGKRDGGAVKSELRIEVMLEDLAPPGSPR